MYRQVIYENYSDTLKRDMNFKKLDKERETIYKYFKRNYLKYFPQNREAKILDLGCGLGSYIFAAKKCGYINVIGVDGSLSCVDFCKKNGIECECADVLEFLKNNESQFDVVLFNDVIEHFTKDEVIEVAKALRATLQNCVQVWTILVLLLLILMKEPVM